MLRYIIALVFITTSILACSNPKKDLQEQIAVLESRTVKVATEARYTDDQLRSLMTLYSQYIQLYPKDELTPIYVYKMGEVYYRVGSWQQAIHHLDILFDKYATAPINEQGLALAGIIYEERFQRQDKAQEIYEKYLSLYPNGQYADHAKLFFKTPEERLLYRIDNLEKQVQENPDDLSNAQLLVYAYRNFVTANKGNEKNPDFCMKGAKLASGLGESFLALELYNTIEKDFPAFGDMPYVLFLTAVEYEQRAPAQWQRNLAAQRPFNGFAAQFRNVDKAYFTEKAKEYYTLFLKKFPTHTLAKDAQLSLESIGKTDDEVVRTLLKKNAKMNSKTTNE